MQQYLFDVYPRFDLTLIRGKGCMVYDEKETGYLDLYGGHGVISIGHTHPKYVERIERQLKSIGFYSNSINMPIQAELAERLTRQSGYPDYRLFLCNSGAEANENALKLASFHTGKRKIVAFKGSFHGRTSAAVNVTDNPRLSAALNRDNFPVEWLELNDETGLEKALAAKDVAAVIVEGIQGVGGLDMPSEVFLNHLSGLTKESGAVLILDEVQSGYGRSGQFFAHQYSGIKPDLITMAKGMGNGFPLAGVLIAPAFEAAHGMLGTTFGGNHLACAAGLAVLEVIEAENLLENAEKIGAEIAAELSTLPRVRQVKGRGLMLGLELGFPIKDLRKALLFEHHILTGSSANPNLLRILPPLTITRENIQPFFNALKTLLS